MNLKLSKYISLSVLYAVVPSKKFDDEEIHVHASL